MKTNNLNFLRLIAAGLVLYGHSAILLGHPEPLFLSWMPLGPLGVAIFFVISGYLVTQSWQQDPNLRRFFIRRCLRIFPGLIVCVLLCIFVLGPWLTSLSLKQYFAHEATWSYLRNIGLYIVYYLPGVFEHGRVPNAVNGSLWSLPLEFFLYIAVALLGMISTKKWMTIATFLASALLYLFWAQSATEMLVVYGTDLRQLFINGTYFWAGAVFYQLDLKRYFSITSVVLAGVGMLCIQTNFPQYLFLAGWGLLPLIVLAFGLSTNEFLTRMTATGDYSYGVYIYAFPVQQAIVFLYPNLSFGIYVGLCSAVTLMLAIFSWHLVEKTALAFKPRSPALAGAIV
nr:acyltransferase [uncultured Undibacterium sp.]